jgi:hypothetical protein
MADRPRPRDGSLPPGDKAADNLANPGYGPGGRLRRPQKAAGRERRYTADIVLTGSWHQPGRSSATASPGASPQGRLASGGQGGRAGGSEPARADLEAAFAAGFTHQAERALRVCAHCGAGAHSAGWTAAGHNSPPGQDPAGGDLPGGFPRGFAPGGVLDQMPPGPELAAHLAAARRAGFGRLSDTERCGVIAAYRRLSSWAAEGELTAITSLDTLRAGSDGRPGEHVDDEIAALLTLTGRKAQELTGLARDLARLPQTRALLAAGIIDLDRADLIAARLAVLSDADAAVVEDKVTQRAGEQTTGELGRALAHAIKAHDPEAAERRKEKAKKNARVEVWTEADGTAALAGRDLPPARVAQATKSLDADARWLKAHGVTGSTDNLRAGAMMALLNHQPLTTLIPPAAPGGGGTAPGRTATGSHAGPRPGSTATGAGSTATGTGSTGPGTGNTTPSPDQAGPRLGGTVHLTMPATTWLGLTDTPGDLPGTGTTDASTCRDLAGTLAANPASTWCITLTDAKGRAIAHGCARAGPGPPGTTGTTGADRRSWLAKVTITPIAAGTCDHRHESAGYQPSDRLRHLVKTRSPRCGYPGCRRPATRCDDDHTVAHHQGGRTCECNLYPLCRHHHQTKQAPGWHLDQPEPGVLVWTTPSGRTYTTTAEPYPV